LCIDVTADVETRKQLENARKTAEETAAARTRLLQIIGHELRTPLNGIVGPLSVIEALEDIDEIKKMLALATAHSNELLHAVSALETVAELESGAVKPELTDVNISTMLERLKTATEKETGSQIDLATSGLRNAVISSDQKTIETIISELLKNACTFGGHNTCDISLAATESVHSDKDVVEITVSNAGQGISFEDAKNLFTPFTRLGALNTGKTRGLGMGLYKAKKFAELLGGDLIYDATDTTRTTFKLHLPIRPS